MNKFRLWLYCCVGLYSFVLLADPQQKEVAEEKKMTTTKPFIVQPEAVVTSNANNDDDILAPASTTENKFAEENPAKKVAKNHHIASLPLVFLTAVDDGLKERIRTMWFKEWNQGEVLDAEWMLLENTLATATNVPLLMDSAPADAILKKGQQFLKKLQLGKARKAFLDAEAMYIKSPQSAMQGLITIWSSLAEIALRTGKDSDAQMYTEKLVSMAPLWLPTASAYPGFINLFIKTRETSLKKSSSIVSIDKTGGAVQWKWDGRDVAGRAPLEITQVLPGKHILTATEKQKDGQWVPVWSSWIETKENEVMKVSPKLYSEGVPTAQSFLQKNMLNTALMKDLAMRAKEKGFSHVLFTGVVQQGGLIQVFPSILDVKSQKWVQGSTLKIGEDLLDASIEILRMRDPLERELQGIRKKNKSFVYQDMQDGKWITELPQVQDDEIVKVALDYPVSAIKETRQVAGAAAEAQNETEEEARVLTTKGKGKRSTSLADDDDRLTGGVKPSMVENDPDAPLNSRWWFWPAVIGAGVGGVAVLGGVTYVSLVALDVLPDPRPVTGGSIGLEIVKP